MSLINQLPEIMEDSRRIYSQWKSQRQKRLLLRQYETAEQVGEPDSNNRLVLGDNQEYMRYLLHEEKLAGQLALIYVDPPFYSKTNYDATICLKSQRIGKIPEMKQCAYHDTWEAGLEEYLRMLTPRFFLMRELLSRQGSLWVHLDWHVVHYVKLILDEIFGVNNLINEVIWNYKSGGTSRRSFSRKHDTLLFYAKKQTYFFQAPKEKSYNRRLQPYCFKGVEEYEDDRGWYTLVNQKDVWQMDMVGRTAAERTGYATQKPEALLGRIIDCCTREGDLCADFFGGSGSFAAAAEKRNRFWISCDVGELALSKARKRLISDGASFRVCLENGNQRCVSRKGSRLELTVSLHTLALSGTMELEIRLKGYDPGDVELLPVDQIHRELLSRIVSEDPLCLLDSWSVDAHYNGIPLRPSLFFGREKGELALSCKTQWDGVSDVAVKATDIFGNNVLQIVKSW